MKICPAALLLLFTAAALPAASPAAEKASANPREDARTAVADAIRLLEAKDYETFLKHYVKPDDFKKITERLPLPEFAKRFGEKKAKPMLDVLKSIKTKEPLYTKDRTLATFAVDVPGAPRNTIEFEKIDKYWYIHN
jgi:hypothetical protein